MALMLDVALRPVHGIDAGYCHVSAMSLQVHKIVFTVNFLPPEPHEHDARERKDGI